MSNSKGSEKLSESLSPRRNRAVRWLPIGGAVVAAAAVVGITAFSGVGSAAPTPTSTPSVAVADRPAAFDYQAVGSKLAVSTLPAVFADDDYLSGLVPSTVRLLASDGAAQYWSGFRDGKLCVLITIDKQSASATSCATSSQFSAGGVGIRLLTSDYAREAYLVPDAVSSKTGISLVLADPFSERASADVQQGTFKLAKLPTVEANEVPSDLLSKLPAGALIPAGLK